MCAKRVKNESKYGSSLLITLLVVSLLLVLVVTFSVYVRLELRAVVQNQSLRRAQANARLAVELGLARLQETAGADTRVTHPLASSPDDAPVSPDDPAYRISHWTMARDAAEFLFAADGTASVNPDRGLPLEPLVSFPPGVTLTNLPPLWTAPSTVSTNAVVLLGPGGAEDAADYVAAPRVDLPDGAYAYWVADEGVKARVDLSDGLALDGDTANDDQRHLHVQRSGVEALMSGWGYDAEDPVHAAWLAQVADEGHLSMVPFATGSGDLARRVPHDATLWSESLLTNVKRGGFQKDLLPVFLEADANDAAGLDWDEYALPPTPDVSPDTAYNGPASATATQIDKLYAHSEAMLNHLADVGRVRPWHATPRETLRGSVSSGGTLFDPIYKPNYRERIFPPLGTVPDNASPVDARASFNRDPADAGDGSLPEKFRGTSNITTDPGGPAWEKLISWATLPRRLSQDSMMSLYSTRRLAGAQPVLIRYSVNRFYTYDDTSKTFHLHFSPVAALWNPHGLDLPAQDYYMQFYDSVEHSLQGSGGVMETLHFEVRRPDGTVERKEWAVRLVSGRPGDNDVHHEVAPVFVGHWRGGLEAGETVTLAPRSGVRTAYGDNTGARGAYWPRSGNVLRCLKPPEETDPAGEVIELAEWDASDLDIDPLGSRYVELDLMRPELDVLVPPDLSRTNTLERISVTFEDHMAPYASALQLSPRWRGERNRPVDLSAAEQEFMVREEDKGPIFGVFQPPIRMTQTQRDWDPFTGILDADRADLPGHAQPVYLSSTGADRVWFGRTVGLRMPDAGDPYLAYPDASQPNLYAPFAQLAFGNPTSPMWGRPPSDRGRNGDILNWGSPPQYIGGWTLDMEPYLSGSKAGFGHDSPFPGEDRRVVLREYPDDLMSLTNPASLQHANLFHHSGVAIWGDQRNDTSFNYLVNLSGMKAGGVGGNLQPAYAIGNSLAPPWIPPDTFQHSVWTDSSLPIEYFNRFHTLYDYSYLMNEFLWDDFIFSSDLNTRLRWTDPSWEADPTRVERDVDSSATQLTLRGGFNVNSVSVLAWEALLKGLRGLDVSLSSGTDTGADSTPFARFNTPDEGAFDDGSYDYRDPEAYERTYRRLTDAQVRALAEALVEEVKSRGPFLSLADFVNRRLLTPSEDPDGHRLKGALQAAIDATDINDAFSGPVLDASDFDDGPGRDDWHRMQLDHMDGVPMNWGAPGFLTQADVLSRIGGALRVRSDTFKIRAYGQDGVGDVNARAACEVVVRRVADYVDPADDAVTSPWELSREVNKRFGRRFEIVSFRWLGEDEI